VAYVALGSNLGDRAGHLSRAREALAALPDTELHSASTVEETPPLGGADQPAYLNQMVRLNTGLTAHELLDACHAIERAAGRERRERWASRTLDLDIVLYGDEHISDPDLTVPHPGLTRRDFWRRELAELTAHGH
jgi:2-amino-4-hydroxy-6-hydroxymethyldihydropteridine diphosphokinase